MMNPKWTLSLAALAITATVITAQSSREQQARRADEIVQKTRRMDLMNQILPLVLTKAQLDKILPAIERARNEVRKAEIVEFELLSKLEPKVDKALKEAIDDQKLPSTETMTEAAATFRTLNLRRAEIISDNVEAVMAVLEKELNAGQKKALANALRPSVINPNIDPTTLTDVQKMRFFVQAILLDREAYDLLLMMSQKRK